MEEETLKTEWILRISPVFQVPRSPSSEEVMFLSVQVKGATHEFRRQTTVLVKNQESLVFVQTDKPIYKPGQTGTKRPTVRTTSKRKILPYIFPNQKPCNTDFLMVCLTSL